MNSPSLWKRLGPGILLAATSIGASHLVLSPQAGALFGFQLMWLVLASHLAKYPAFEFGPRYAAATGNSLVVGYSKVPGPANWALFVFLGSTVIQGVGVLSGVVSISGCVLATWTSDPKAEVLFSFNAMEVFSVCLLAAIIALLFSGGFSLLDHLNKLVIGALTLATILAFIPVFPEPSEFRHLFVPSLPEGSIVLVAAVLGWMPTGIDVSVWHSFWTLEKLKQFRGARDREARSTILSNLRLSLADMRIGYVLSLLTGLMFMGIGAAHLTGIGSQLKGVEFAEAISMAYTASLGKWMYHVFMVTAFFAMFSTSYTVIDGFSRAFSETVSTIKPSMKSRKAFAYKAFVIFSGLLATVILLVVGNPVNLVLAASMTSLAIAPILYALNLYCVRHHIEDPAMRPAAATIILGWIGTGFMAVALAVTIYTTWFKG